MYSNNDFRTYSDQSLSHGWGNKPAQKAREKEYNAWYYATHPEKWGVKKHLENLEDKVNEKVTGALDKGLLGKTDIDNRLYEAGKSAYSKLKSKTEKNIVNAGQKHLTSSAMQLEQAKRNYEANRNASTEKAYHEAQKAYNATARGRVERAIDSGATKAAKSAEKAYTSTRDRIGRAATQAELNAVGAKGTLSRAAKSAKNAINDRIDRAATQAELNAVGAKGTLSRAAKSAKNAINDRIDRSATTVDDNLRGAYRAVKAGDTSGAKTHLKNAGKEIGNDLRRAAGGVKNAASTVGNVATNRIRNVTNEANATNATRKAIEAGARDPETLRRNAELSRTLGGRAANATDAVKTGARDIYDDTKAGARDIYNRVTGQGKYDKERYTQGAQRRTSNQELPIQERRAERVAPKSTTGISKGIYSGQRPSYAGKNNDVNDSGTGRRYSNADTASVRNTFENIAEQTAKQIGVAASGATKAVSAASSLISSYQRAVERFGYDSPQANEAYYEVLGKISEELRERE